MATPEVPFNIFRGALQGILGFTNTQVRVLMEDEYDSQDSVMYCKFTDMKELCKLKSKIHASRGGVSYGYRKMKFLQSLDCEVTDFMLRGKIIDLNNFNTDILADSIEESRIDFEDTIDGKGGLSNPKELSHENRAQWEGVIYNYFMSGKNIHSVPLSYVIIKDMLSPKELFQPQMGQFT